VLRKVDHTDAESSHSYALVITTFLISIYRAATPPLTRELARVIGTFLISTGRAMWICYLRGFPTLASWSAYALLMPRTVVLPLCGLNFTLFYTHVLIADNMITFIHVHHARSISNTYTTSYPMTVLQHALRYPLCSGLILRFLTPLAAACPASESHCFACWK
jgi:hypothetical protein